jgi:AcrR family transcriptional regulator
MNHLVTRADVAEEQPSLREAQAAATRRRIVDGLLAVLAEDHPATLSVPAVARRAGVSVATVYRYFPTKEALLDAGSEVADQLIEQSGGPGGLDGLEAFLLRAGTAFQAWAPLVQAQVASPLGREVRRRRLPRSLVAVRAALAHEGIDPTGPEGERLTRLVATFISSVTILDLMERQGHSPEVVAADLAWAAAALVRTTQQELRTRSTADPHDTSTDDRSRTSTDDTTRGTP